MKRILLALVAITTIALSSFGQAPEGFKYQAVVRDAGNFILTNQAVGIQMTIQQGSIGGTTVYQETFAPTTNTYGLVNLEIGNGTVVSGDFTTIDWSAGPYYIETAVDLPRLGSPRAEGDCLPKPQELRFQRRPRRAL